MIRVICLIVCLWGLQGLVVPSLASGNTTLLALFSCDDTYYCANRTSYLVQLDPSTGQYVAGYNVSIDVNVHYPGPYTYNEKNDAYCFSMENDVNRSAAPVLYVMSLQTNKTRSIEVNCGDNCWRFISLTSYENEVYGVVYPEKYLNNFTFVRVDLTTNQTRSTLISLSSGSQFGTEYGAGLSHVFLNGVPYVMFLARNGKQKSHILVKINLLTNAVENSTFPIGYCANFAAYSNEVNNTVFYCYDSTALWLVDISRPDKYRQLYRTPSDGSGFSDGGALDVEDKKFYTTWAGWDKAYRIYTYDIETNTGSGVSSPLDNNVNGLNIYRRH